MDQFEAARIKHAKNLERKARTVVVPQGLASEEKVVFIEQPKSVETKGSAAVISVTVTLPDGEFSFSLVKPGIFANVPRSRLTRASFVNAVTKGLEPLLGGVKIV